MRNQPEPFLVDCSLRDGLQAPGFTLSLESRKRIADGLAAAGFREIEAGLPAGGGNDSAILRYVRDLELRSIAWCRARSDDLEASEDVGTGAVHVAFPASRRLLTVSSWSEAELPDRIESLVSRALKGHDFVSVGFMDCFRADVSKVSALVSSAFSAGAHRVRLADSVGLATPDRIRRLAAEIDPRQIDRIEFHAHDDLGLALGNGLEALNCGFGGISGTIAGMGERAGNLAWERLAMIPADSNPVSSLLNPRVLVMLALEFHQMGGRDIPRRMPVIGRDCRLHESGIHAAAHYRDPEAYMPWNPASVGLPPARVAAGSSSGRGGLAGLLKELGASPSDGELSALVNLVRTKPEVSPGKLLQLYRTLTEKSA